MTIRAAFAKVDITPPLGISKIGWLRDIKAEEVLDPLYARVAILESADDTFGFAQLDTLAADRRLTREIREGIEAAYGYPGGRVMVAATHNHAGPAVADAGDVTRDEAYTGSLVAKVVGAFGKAFETREDAVLGFGTCFEFGLSQNRRVVMRDGTVRTHGTFDDPEALYLEGPIDPEVAVLGVRAMDGRWLGCVVNFACHPTHHGGETALSAGYPGVLAARMKDAGCPVTLFLNGACGNLHTADPASGGKDRSKEEVGARLAESALRVLEEIDFRDDVRLASSSRTIALPYRAPTEAECRGTIRGAQRFVDPAIYDRKIPELVERIRRQRTELAEVQAHFIDEVAFVSMPAELFVQLGLRLKEEAHPAHALVVGYANGNLGYVPHKEAFRRGGYETTFLQSSCMAPEAGDMLVDCAVELIREKQ